MIASPVPAGLGTGLLHLGPGAFHRAHQAAFTQDVIAAAGGDRGTEEVSMRSATLAEALDAQGGCHTRIERRPDGPRLQQVSVIRRAHALPGNAGAVAGRMAAPGILIVTMTVTEKGHGADLARRRIWRTRARRSACPGCCATGRPSVATRAWTG